MVEEEGGVGNDSIRWGTWEELILGGAVLRHGPQDWNAVASEVQTRTKIHPYLFTPQVCKAKYEALQEIYSGCSAWVEELRIRRVEELRKALAISEDSIGSLETKLESLKTEKGVCNNAGYSSSRAEAPVLFFKSERNESSGQEASKDRSSAGSFTHETQTTWSQPAATEASVGETEKKPVVIGPSRLERFPSIDQLAETMRSEHGVSIKGRRGKRRRKDLSKDVKEGSVGENNLVSSADVMTTSHGKEKLICDSVQPTILPDVHDQNPCSSKQGKDEFTKILDSIMENDHASVFRRRLDSQKRARYRSIIRQHMDLDTIRSRIANKFIKSIVELLRDLLLLANNALVFYSKSTREYKCALVLRDLVTKRLHQHYKAVGLKIAAVEIPKSPIRKPPAKPRSARPFNRKFDKELKAGGCIIAVPKVAKPVSCNVGSPSSAESSALTKKSPGRRGKIGRVKRGNTGIQAETPMKVRKRAKVK